MMLQEVQAGPASALAAVVAADVQLMALRAEEGELNRRLGVSEDASSAVPAQNGHSAANGVSAAASEEEAEAEAEAQIESAAATGMEQLTVKENGSCAPDGLPQNGSLVGNSHAPFCTVPWLQEIIDWLLQMGGYIARADSGHIPDQHCVPMCLADLGMYPHLAIRHLSFSTAVLPAFLSLRPEWLVFK